VSDDLRSLLETSGGKAMSVRQILDHTHGRGLHMICIILCLPFLSPVSVPFLSIPFGMAIAICGLRIAFRHKPWLPGFVLRSSIPAGVLGRILRFGIAAHVRIEKFLRARATVFVSSHAAHLACGISICLSAIFLSLPIPPPFPLTNTIPGFAIILLCLGMIESDGVAVCVGHGLTFIAAVYVAFIAFLGKAGVDFLWKVVAGWAG